MGSRPADCPGGVGVFTMVTVPLRAGTEGSLEAAGDLSSRRWCLVERDYFVCWLHQAGT